MTRYQIKKKQANMKRKLMISIGIIVIGLGMVITALVLEASNYPWGLLFGTATQNDEEIADPAPIVLDEEDQDVLVTEDASPQASVSELPVTASPEAEDTSSSPEVALPGDETETQKAPAVSKYVVLGTFKIPVLKVSQNLLEGAGRQMKYGVGHIPGTAAVGQPGNCAVAGHRDYPFRYLDQLKSGDSIVIKAGGVKYTYTVFDKFDVLPNEVWVLNSIPGESYTLTVITCTPYMVSSHRLIIWARLTDIDGMTPQAYYGIPDITEEATVSPEQTDTAAQPTPSAEETSDPSDIPTETTTGETAPAAPLQTPTDQPAEASAPATGQVPETAAAPAATPTEGLPSSTAVS